MRDYLPNEDLVGIVQGLHHIRIPVSDPWVSRDWYMMVLGLQPLLDVEEENGVVGVVLRHPEGFVVGLHRDPLRALALKGFAILGLTILDREKLQDLSGRLHLMGIPHLPIEEGHLGWYIDVPDPDGILVRFHTGSGPDTEEA
jgi:catechol 2,3-dioxygenase-like lactoylglutathione lyase family enzyme